MTNNEEASKPWGCGTCTYLNTPMFLACEMCGQARPSQGPTRPVRQPSFQSDVDVTSVSSIGNVSMGIDVDLIDSIMIGSTGLGEAGAGMGTGNCNGTDRAPRRVRRHRSSGRPTVDITGTLIMTDDPADYPTQDGKKPAVREEEEADILRELDVGGGRHADPTLDDSMDRELLRGPAHVRAPTDAAAAAQGQEQRRQSPKVNVNSNHTLPTFHMGGSSSSRLFVEDPYHCSFNNDDATACSSISGSITSSRATLASCRRQHLRSNGNGLPHPHHASAAAAAAAGPEIHWRNQNTASSKHCSCSGAGSNMEISGNSHYSAPSHSETNSTSVRSPATPRGTRSMLNSSQGQQARRPSSSAASMRNLRQDQSARALMMKRGTSMVSVASPLPAAAAAAAGSGDFLPSIAPPPVPTMDSPGDVDVMAVLQRDRAHAERRASIEPPASNTKVNGRRKSRAAMLTNLMVAGSNTGGSSIATSNSKLSLATSTRRLGGGSGLEAQVAPSSPVAAEMKHHPGERMDEALESPKTRKQRNKPNKRRMQGGIRAVMASMRIAGKATN